VISWNDHQRRWHNLRGMKSEAQHEYYVSRNISASQFHPRQRHKLRSRNSHRTEIGLNYGKKEAMAAKPSKCVVVMENSTALFEYNFTHKKKFFFIIFLIILYILYAKNKNKSLINIRSV